MAQLSCERELDTKEDLQNEDRIRDRSRSSAAAEGSSFRFNASAPEYVPALVKSPVQVPVAGYFYPCFQYVDGTTATAGSWVYVSDQEIAIRMVQSKPAVKAETTQTSSSPATSPPPPQQQQQQNQAKEIILTDEIRAKIIKQV